MKNKSERFPGNPEKVEEQTALHEVREEMLAGVKRAIPSGQHLIVSMLAGCEIKVSKGAKLTVREAAAGS